MSHDYGQAASYIAALTGSADTPVWFRAIHDVDKGVAAYDRYGTLAQHWNELVALNRVGRGIFIVVNATDGRGKERENMTDMRAVFVDLDDVATSAASYQAAMQWGYGPHFTVWSSPNKYHVYWLVNLSRDHQTYESTQRRLARQFGGDPVIWDTPRVMRLPGFLHMKRPEAPSLVSIYQGSAWGRDRYGLGDIAGALASVPDEGGGADDHGLRDPALAAPSLDWAVYALNKVDPNTLDRAQWIKLTAAFKQAVSTLTDDDTAFAHWSAWCARYDTTAQDGRHLVNDIAENLKQWNSIRSTRAGWPALRDTSGVRAEMMFGTGPGVMPAQPQQQQGSTFSSKFLTAVEQAQYFAGCYLIKKDGKILTPSGRFMDATKFNAAYGGYQFMIKEDGTGATTDEPWKAATRGQLFQVPKVDHVRFLPREPSGSIIVDELGRQGINTYIPAQIDMLEGDPSPFVNHLRRILPTEGDLLILLNYLARIVQSPGVKIPWAPVIQSAEGVGKNVIKFCMSHAIGSVYRYYPKASELAETGGKFNAWMRSRLFILCDEVKTDDKRNLIEALKDLVSEEQVQIQGKGVDQDVEDNYANWVFFTNHKDAIPIDRKSRRWAIFYSPLQNDLDLVNAGMNASYYSALYKWVRGDGKRIVAHYLKHYQIDPALDPEINQRAPKTSSYDAAIVASRTAPEAAIYEAVETQRAGFRGGWISSAAVAMLLKENDIRTPTHAIIARIIEGMGYVKIGRATRGFLQEGNKQPNLYSTNPHAAVSDYPALQGYGAA